MLLTLLDPPANFYWEIGSSNLPVQDDPALEDYNVEYLVNLFVEECFQQATVYRTVSLRFSVNYHVNMHYCRTTSC